ncbi:MAG: ABC transporter ATP-binding protein [Nitrospinota bacterium]|nr:ABC transporter ATP-binding protein [Nitrospinota bacterium]
MTVVRIANATVEFPIYGGSTSRSLKKVLVRAATGGIMARDAEERVVVRALDNISLEINEGDQVGLVGHNGSGKSTLLRLIAGIYEPISGFVEVKGKITSMLDIFHGTDLEATGLENIYMRGRVLGIHPSKMKAIVDEIVDFTGIGDFMHLPMRTYSSGMRMRLMFGVATCVKADIMLMDEWLSAGDASFLEKAKQRMEEMTSEARVLILASHNIILVKERCNKIVYLEHGKIVNLEVA